MTEDEAGDRCSQEAWRLSMHLLENKIKHAIWFTGGGFHIWVMLDKNMPCLLARPTSCCFRAELINKWFGTWTWLASTPWFLSAPTAISDPPTLSISSAICGLFPCFGPLGDKWSFYEQMAQEPKPGFYLVGEKGLEIEIVKQTQTTTSLFPYSDVQFNAEDIQIEMERIQNIPVLPCLAAGACEKGSNPTHQHRTYLMMYLMDFFRNFARPPATSQVKNKEVVNKTHAFIKTLTGPTTTQQSHKKCSPTVRTDSIKLQPVQPSSEKDCAGRCPYYDEKAGF